MMAAPSVPAPMSLGELVAGIAALPHAVAALPVSSLALDTRQLASRGLFLACSGARHHGLEFAEAAKRAGASAILAEPTEVWPRQRMDELAAMLGVPVLPVPGLSHHAGELASRFHRNPGSHLRMVGVTGTNGKTSCTHFLAQALEGRQHCALIGTLGNGFTERLSEATHTTPDAVSVQALLADFVDRGATAVAMEVSSHALHQRRVAGVGFEVAVFTNLTRDHLDYHRTMEAYAEAKARLFTGSSLRAAVINADDAFGQRLLATLPGGVMAIAYGLNGMEHSAFERWLAAESVKVTPQGLELAVVSSWGRGELHGGVLGRFNAYNLLAVLGALLALGVPFGEALKRVGAVAGVPGRMELFNAPGRPAAVVDYAHTPDALEQVLHSVRAHCRGRLWCLFGCGGDRDRGKRPLMGEVAERLADVVMLTNDNPRSEDEGEIIAEIRAGMRQPQRAVVERDRGRAIARALGEAGREDWVLVAGKGHEEYQTIGDLTLPFSDRVQVRRALGEGAS